EELAHLEIVGTLVYKLTRNASVDELKKAGFGGHYAEHERALFYTDAVGNPWTAACIQAKGDPIADLTEDMAAEGAIS
ncbi:MAG: manganese catalase family protein, partial [Clostridia bacterium]|nr:manganese catalase family protein [Clostridia bacterium]